jgi:hypothetical protein
MPKFEVEVNRSLYKRYDEIEASDESAAEEIATERVKALPIEEMEEEWDVYTCELKDYENVYCSKCGARVWQGADNA